MKNYVDYQFYVNKYAGKLSSEDFRCVLIKASAYVRRITLGRADSHMEDEEVKLATCAVCDVFSADEKRRNTHQGQNIVSENNDGYSVSFVQEQNTGETSEELVNRKAYKAAELFLLPTGLLNRRVNYHDNKCAYYHL